jgi:hypothetical protein
MTTPANAAVRTRRLHYFSGFDPRGAAHYHRLCREEAAKPQPHGGVLEVGSREKLSATVSRWWVEWRPAPGTAEAVRTEHVFMGWDDLVRANWSRHPLVLARELVQTYAHLFRHVGARRVWRMYRPAFKAGILPLLVVLAPLLFALFLSAAAGVWGAAAGAVLCAVAWALALRGGLPWLLRIYTFYVRASREPDPAFDARTREWGQLILDRQQAEPVDEVLLVGHSVGALVMLDTVRSLLQDPRWRELRHGRPTAVLTLGQSLPVVAMAPGSVRLRDALSRLSQAPDVCWWDVTARIDPLCFYNLHPLAGTGLPCGQAPWPVLHNARFMSMYEAAAWTRIRRDKLKAHFLYLLTPQKPGNFSPADVLYGPRSLQAVMQAKGAMHSTDASLR